MNILVTGGTVFVSKYVAEYFAQKGNHIYVLNRNNHKQPKETTLIKGDRDNLGYILKNYEFDAVLDINSYTGEDVEKVLQALGSFKKYILISSSAVYPETQPQPFIEESILGKNKFWGDYGTNKIAAEKLLLEKVPEAYILRPPYLYGPMNNVYREAFVFDCALNNRTFYLPQKGKMKLQFLYIEDLCKIIEEILLKNPNEHILNVGNKETITVKEWIELCYSAVGIIPRFYEVMDDIEQRQYFSFYSYEYTLDVTKQNKIFSKPTPLEEGIRKSLLWYKDNQDKVSKRKYIEFIDEKLKN